MREKICNHKSDQGFNSENPKNSYNSVTKRQSVKNWVKKVRHGSTLL